MKLTRAAQKEVEELRQTGVYVAGFTDPEIRTRGDLWDLFIDRTRSLRTYRKYE
jgi:nucleoside-triphosphatase THEP1